MTRVLEVSTATATRESGLKLAESAVAAGLAASGQVTGPVASFFWHAGQFGKSEEWKVTFKTVQERYPALEAHLTENHEWTNPEVTGIEVSEASPAYIQWVERSTTKEIGDNA